MANEGRITTSLTITKDNLSYSKSTSKQFDVTTAKGPAVGAILVATGGTQLVTTEVTTPGMCRLTNLDTANYVQFGSYDGSTFRPTAELLAGESYTFRLPRTLTGTLRLVANTAACNVLVELFDK